MSVARLCPKKFEGRHVLFALLAFFGVTFVVNGIFLYYAVGTFNGFDTIDAYRKGVTYNERIALDVAQAALGWQPVARYDNGAQKLVVEVRDGQGRAITGLIIAGQMRRPVTDAQDRAIALRESTPGLYTVPVPLDAGQWDFSGRISQSHAPDQTAFRFKQRLWVGKSP
ncbi:MAG: FixH family protein [Alphaproteobacteria bacterium]